MDDRSSDDWVAPEIDFCDLDITQGSFEASIDTYTSVSCMVDVETVFDPRVRFIVTGRNEETGTQAKVDLRLSDREELLAMAHRIIEEYGEDDASESDATAVVDAPEVRD